MDFCFAGSAPGAQGFDSGLMGRVGRGGGLIIPVEEIHLLILKRRDIWAACMYGREGQKRLEYCSGPFFLFFSRGFICNWTGVLSLDYCLHLGVLF